MPFRVLPSALPLLLALVPPDLARSDDNPSQIIDCWASEASGLESVVCDDPVLRAWDDALAEHLAGRPGAVDAIRTRLSKACGLDVEDSTLEAIQRLERTGCLVPRYRDAMVEAGIAAEIAAPTLPEIVHPLCLGMAHTLWGEPLIAELPMEACRAGTAHIPVERDANGTLYAFGLSVGSPTYVAYTPLQPLPDGRQTALIRQNTGGTGVFSAIVAFTTGPTLTVETLVQGGDRCNGGIASARMEGADWIIAFDITPFDVAEVIGAGNSPAAEALPSCAICCAAEVEIRFPADGDGVVLSLTGRGDAEVAGGGGPAEACLMAVLGPASAPIPASAFPDIRARFDACLAGR